MNPIQKIIDDLNELYDIVRKIREGRGTEEEKNLISQVFGYFVLEDRATLMTTLETLQGTIKIATYYRDNPGGKSDFQGWNPRRF